MSYFEALLYGVVQGLSEYLPISSSAHLVLLPKFLGTKDPGLAFDVFVHAGTLAATLVYFRRDWVAMLRARQRTLLFRVVMATVPALVAGALLHSWIEHQLRGVGVLAFTLAIFGGLLWWIDQRAHKKKHARPFSALTSAAAIKIGVAQMLALVPGVSRSGITMTAARGLGFSREAAARFSFLLSAPVTGAALVFESRKLQELLSTELSAGILVVAALAAFSSGWLAIAGLLKLIQKQGYAVFAIYRIALAFTILAF